MLLHITVICSFGLLRNILLYGHTAVCLSIFLLRATWAVSITSFNHQCNDIGYAEGSTISIFQMRKFELSEVRQRIVSLLENDESTKRIWSSGSGASSFLLFSKASLFLAFAWSSALPDSRIQFDSFSPLIEKDSEYKNSAFQPDSGVDLGKVFISQVE